MPRLALEPIRDLTHVLGHDAAGLVGRMPATGGYAVANAVGDGTRVQSSAISIGSGSANLTVTGAAFVNADVGKTILVPGAGVSGAALVTTIASRSGSTQVALSATAGTALSSVWGVIWYGTDDTAAIQAAIDELESYTGGTVFLPHGVSGIYICTDTISVERTNVLIKGAAPPGLANASGVQLIFLNAVDEKVFIASTPLTSSLAFEDLTIEDGQERTSILVRCTAFPQTQSDVNSFGFMNRVWLKRGKIGIEISTDGDVLLGAEQNWVDSFSYFHVTFNDCLISVRAYNMQAFHHCFYGCNWLGGYPGHGPEAIFIDDHCGMGISVFGGSMLGACRFYRTSHDPAATAIWIQGYLNLHDVRMEARTSSYDLQTDSVVAETPYGCLIEQNQDQPPLNVYHRCSIFWENCDILVFSASGTDVLRYSGSLNAIFRNCEAGSTQGLLKGFARIRQNPVVGISQSFGAGAFGSVTVEGCSGFTIVQNTADDYGTFNAEATPRINVKSASRVNLTMLPDADGFFYLSTDDLEQKGYGYSVGDRRFLRWNNDKVEQFFGIASVPLIAPKGAMPLTFSFAKHPVQFSMGITWKLYLVKDKADWAGASFDVDTDAYLIATTPDSRNKAGLFEVAVQLTDDVLTGAFQAGATGWTEGRLYAQRTGNLLPSNVGDWLATRSTLTKVGPVGVMTEDGSTNTHFAGWFISKPTTSTTRIITVKAKRVAAHATRDIVIQDNVLGNGVYCLFDLGGGGAIGPTAFGTGWSADDASQTGPDGDGFYVNTFEYTTGAEDFQAPQIYLSAPGTGSTYTGDGVSGVQFSDVELPGLDAIVCGHIAIGIG